MLTRVLLRSLASCSFRRVLVPLFTYFLFSPVVVSPNVA